MKNARLLAWLSGLLLFGALSTCSKPPTYPDEPQIEYRGTNKASVLQGNPQLPIDTLLVFFSFTDGDGDISFPSDSLDIFLTDSRTDLTTNLRFPVIPAEGTGNGISGEVTLRLINRDYLCCINNNFICRIDPAFPRDTVSFTVQIRDRAGNLSNKIQTETIELRCNG